MFDEALEYASTTLPANSSAMLSNLDTYLDHHSPWDRFGGTLEGWTSGVSNKTISLALSRYEADLDGSLWRNADLAKVCMCAIPWCWLVIFAHTACIPYISNSQIDYTWHSAALWLVAVCVFDSTRRMASQDTHLGPRRTLCNWKLSWKRQCHRRPIGESY